MRNNNAAQKGMMILMLALLLAFNTASAEWGLLQNSPTTNDLHSVHFLDDNTGWMAGDSSTIFKTTDSGQSWVQQTSPEASNFQCIIFVNADTGWACGTGGTVIKTTDGGSNWLSQTFTESKFNSMDFFNANIGYIAGDNGNIRKTTNGGSAWTIQDSGVPQNLHQIKLIDSDTLLAVGANAIILKTDNSGLDWAVVSPPGIGGQILYTLNIQPPQIFDFVSILSTGTVTKRSDVEGGWGTWYLGGFPLEAIYSITYLLNGLNYGVGANGYIVNSTDVGNSWNPQESPTTQNLYSVNYPDSYNFIWAVGAGGTILRDAPAWLKQTYVPNQYLSSLHFINASTGYAVGVAGTILKTTNSGTSWDTLSSGTSNYLWSVYFPVASTGYTVGGNGTILKTTNSGATWGTLTSGTTRMLSSVYFPDASTGYAVGDSGTILKTTNSGSNWDTLLSGTTAGLISVYFTDASTGYAVGDGGTILKTSNSGTSWDTLSSGTTQLLFSVYFTNASTGYAVGYLGTILKTTDGGMSWDALSAGTSDLLRSVCFIDDNIGYVCSPLHIYKTSDGGSNWFEDDLPPIDVYISEIKFVVENNTAVGLAVGDQILRTSFEYLGGDPIGNSGNYPGWVPVNSGTDQYVGGVEYINPFVAFAVGGTDPPGTGNGTILRTINGGQTWTRQQSNIGAEFGAVSFADVNNGIAVGYPSYIVHTTNAGLDWVQQTSPTGHTLNDVDMLDETHAYICGDNAILYTADGGDYWELRSPPPPNEVWTDVDFINQTTATACGATIIRTTDAGWSWFRQNSGVLDYPISIDFIDENNGIAVTQNGPSLYTTNGGTSWLQGDTLFGYIQKVCYIDTGNAYATGSGGLVYRTTNGGISWELQNTNTVEDFRSVNFADANNGVITGSDGMILRTSNGGVISGTNNSYDRNGLSLSINDFQNTNDSVYVNLVRLDQFAVTRVYVTIDTVLHTNDSDLEFYLEHNGIIDTLIYRNGGSGDNFLGTLLNDENNFPLMSGSAPFRGSFQPYRPLSRFNGQNPNGYWNLRVYDGAAGSTGTLEAWSLTLVYQPVTSITEDIKVPLKYSLSQNYPNPFNPSTIIRYELTEPSFVSIRIFNILGQEVASLVNERKPAGNHEINFNAGSLSSGIYFYRLQAGSIVQTRKMLLLK